jgi:hypothetical protein
MLKIVEVRKRLSMALLLMNGALLNLVAKLTTLVLMQRMEKLDKLETLKTALPLYASITPPPRVPHNSLGSGL